MAKLRRSPAEDVAIIQICSYSNHASNSPRAQAEISGSLRGRCGRTSRLWRIEIAGTTAVATNPGYAKLFAELDAGSLPVGIGLVVLIETHSLPTLVRCYP